MRVPKELSVALAAIILVAGIVIVATSGDSISVRFLTLIVTVDIATRLYVHSSKPG